MLTSDEIRNKFLEYYRQRGHAVVPSISLLPQGDVTTVFTGSGMQPLIKYLLGEPHPNGTRIVDSQKSFRSEDIDEVGDNRHTTFFEMLGNWSLGDYFKAEQLPWVFEFLVKELGAERLDAAGPDEYAHRVRVGGQAVLVSASRDARIVPVTMEERSADQAVVDRPHGRGCIAAGGNI